MCRANKAPAQHFRQNLIGELSLESSFVVANPSPAFAARGTGCRWPTEEPLLFQINRVLRDLVERSDRTGVRLVAALGKDQLRKLG
jgi:hypothetical protein